MTMIRIFSVSLLFAVAACATTEKERDVQNGQDESRDSVAGAESPETYLEQTAAITGQEFIDQPPGNLEALLGAPAFVRREGVGEFRRYDTGACRIYAVIAADAGGRPLIKSISTSAIGVDAPAPSLNQCLTGS